MLLLLGDVRLLMNQLKNKYPWSSSITFNFIQRSWGIIIGRPFGIMLSFAVCVESWVG